MACPYCGGYHSLYYDQPKPAPTIGAPHPPAPSEMQGLLQAIGQAVQQERRDPYDRDPLPSGGRLWTGRVYGTDDQGREVTAAFGRDGTSRTGHTMISLGHVSGLEFYADKNGAGRRKGHDHAMPGHYVDRGRYPE